MVWSSASSTLISPLVSAFVIRSSPNTTRSVPLVRLERHCIVYALSDQRCSPFDVVRHIPKVRPASSRAIHPPSGKEYSPKFGAEEDS